MGTVSFQFDLSPEDRLLLRSIMATQQELVQQLGAIQAQVNKIGGETTALVQKVKDLTDLLNSGSVPVTPELAAAVQAVADQVKVVDDLVPDVTPG